MDPEKQSPAQKKNNITEDKPSVIKNESPVSRFLSNLSGVSRFGRTIKPKSPNTITQYFLSSAKNLTLPKKTMEGPISEDSCKRIDESTETLDETLNNSIDISNNAEDEKINIEDIQTKSPYTLGQGVWARQGKNPFWPSIVTLDPASRSYVSNKPRSGTKTGFCAHVHVRFCADRERHNWIPITNVIPFNGKADLEKQVKNCVSTPKKKYSVRALHGTLKTHWDDAVKEMNELMSKSIEERIKLFKPKSEENKEPLQASPAIQKSDDTKRKRKQSNTSETSTPKKAKSNLEIAERSEGITDNKLDKKVNLDTPPTPPSSHKDSSDEAPVMKKHKVKRKIDPSKDGVFEIFCERNREVAEQQDPDASEADVLAYLQDVWDGMNPYERSKYRGDYLPNEERRRYNMDIDEDNEDDSDSDLESDKPSRSKVSKASPIHDETSDSERSVKKRKSKADRDRSKSVASDQEETTSVESENTGKTSKKRRTKTRCESSDRDDISVDSEISEKSGKKRKLKADKGEEANKEISPLLDSTSRRARQIKLFKGVKTERVCQRCEGTGTLIRCKGSCYSYYHPACVKASQASPENSDGENHLDEASKENMKATKKKLKENNSKDDGTQEIENFKCSDCESGITPPCFVCKGREDERVKCSSLFCGKYYHNKCLKMWPQCQRQGDRLICPYHVCHTCISDNPQTSHGRSANERFIRCIRCPSTYHFSISCIPAGSNILTTTSIICPRHYQSSNPPINATWCFLCTKGGRLICCDSCPMSFHTECLGIDTPDGDYICEDCETGRMPLYGEVVWVKYGHYRWWPSVICFPFEIPENVASRPHKTGEFCVMFLGSRDYGWVYRGKVFPFQDGDAESKNVYSDKKGEPYRRALGEAKLIHDRFMLEKAMVKDKDSNSKHLRPPPYVKIRTNKPVGNVRTPEIDSITACNCDPNDSNPCSTDSDCLNRILMVECSPDVCPAGTKCQNQSFVLRKYPAMKPVHTEERGWGLRALEFIKEGQFVIEYVGEVIDEAEYRLRLKHKKEIKNDNFYFLTIDPGRMIDAEPKGNLSRFMNHSCQPNCKTEKWTVNGDTRIGLFALRDIESGEELTFNYNLACDGETKKPCLCKASNCSGFIGLKVTKQPISLLQQKKIEKAEKVKRQKRQQKKVPLCWNCNSKIDNLDEASKCDQKTCGKYYHPHCIDIEEGQDPIFHCPWHFCAECYKRTSLRCSYCCNAFCLSHTYGSLREQPDSKAYVCYNHPVEFGNAYDLESSEPFMMYDQGSIVAGEDFKHYLKKQTEVSSPYNDKNAPRGTIVEVQGPSSEDEEVSEQEDNITEADISEKAKSNLANIVNGDGRKSVSPKKNPSSTANANLSLDEIAAIIGIVE
ncbi:hypothetical protein QAD02_015764 [Eretmocerus hayati]|uniref:Uncharacterized protein n=1 Tax=Eretmocerus hayati TaxID=131215 RepID=A0ACC2PC15_9HYME|nr:hypothetical protein QAD02_015764 [Eretmocerus hayati]